MTTDMNVNRSATEVLKKPIPTGLDNGKSNCDSVISSHLDICIVSKIFVVDLLIVEKHWRCRVYFIDHFMGILK